MTDGYDLELLRVALEHTIDAARAIAANHNPPDWLCHRLTHIIGECESMLEATRGGEK